MVCGVTQTSEKDIRRNNIMRKIIKKIVAEILVTTIIFWNVAGSYSYAKYDRDQAVTNAREWYRRYPTYLDWYTFSSDCTNFVSVCEAYAGVVSTCGSTTPTSDTKDVVCEKTSKYWYMIKKSRNSKKYGDKYYAYSKSWACVSDFRAYFSRFSNFKTASVIKYSIKDNNNINYLCSKLQKGDVLQYDNGEHKHSVIITATGNSVKSVKYCGHTNSYYNKELRNFIEKCEDYNITTVYVTHFK